MPCKSSRNNRRHTSPSARPAVGIITAPNPSAGTHTRGPRAHAPDSATDIRTRAPREAPCARRGLWDTRPAPGRRPPWHMCAQGPTRHDHGTTTARPRRDHGATTAHCRHDTTTVHGTIRPRCTAHSPRLATTTTRALSIIRRRPAGMRGPAGGAGRLRRQRLARD